MQQPLCCLRERAIRLQFQIFVQSFFGARSRYDLAVLIGGFFGDQVHAFLVVRLSFIGVGGNGFIKRSNRLVGFAGVGEYRALVVIELGSPGRIQLRSLIVGLYGFLDLADFGLGLCQVVVVRGKGPEVVWFFLGLGIDRFLFDVNCFLIIAHGLGVPPRFLSRVGLLRS